MDSQGYALDAPTRLSIAVEASTTDRAIKSALIGKTMKPILYNRIKAVFEKRGLLHLLPGNGTVLKATG